MSQNIKGQEIIINIVADGQLEDELTAVVDENDAADIETIAKGYLGEKTDRHDDILNGYSGNFTLHIQKASWYVFRQKIENRAKRITPDMTFSISKTLQFANGDSPTIIFPDIKFGKIEESAGSRQDYLTIKMSFACDNCQVTGI
jgi:hypothetical protein